MTILQDYHQFDGINYFTGPIRNVLDYQGVRAPHSGQPLSEALLFGISGGIVAGYFVFEYQGLSPWLHFLTRNTFDPMETIWERLGVPVQAKESASPQKGAENLEAALAAGTPAIVWADAMSLVYNNLPFPPGEYMLMPLVVYGIEPDGRVLIADRARVPLSESKEAFAQARARTGKNRHRLVTLGAPDLSRLPEAVTEGLRTSVRLFLDEPPLAPLKGKFGRDAYRKWADLLVDPKNPKGWKRQFASGERLLSGLVTGYRYIELFGTGGSGARGEFARFLDEAAQILGKPALGELAGRFREIAGLWGGLVKALLPDDIPPLAELRALMDRDYQLFIERGLDSLEERRALRARSTELMANLKADFPLDEAGAAALRETLRERVLEIALAEEQAIMDLREALE